jgi:alkylhydroperoxidase/carboxymuconolactone decarboxylase family protein YurZ
LPSGSEIKQRALDMLDSVFGDSSVPVRLRRIASTSYLAASRLWQTVLDGQHLSPRMKELVLLALHASATAINAEAIKRHVERATSVGASEEDVLDVLLSIVGVSNHAMYFAIPILLHELNQAGQGEDLPEFRADINAIKDEFVRTRGFWNQERDLLARLVPDYFTALSALSMEPWKHGSLSPKEREFIYIAIDCSVTHTYSPGLALHIRNALGQGASRDEILEVFQLAALMGLEGYILGAEALHAAASPALDADP